MPKRLAPAEIPVLNSVTTPVVVMRPIRSIPRSVNQRLPSGPAAMPKGFAPAVIPALNSVTAPAGVIRPIGPAPSVNQRLPSGPAVMEKGKAPGVMPIANSVTICASAPLDSKQSAAKIQQTKTRQCFKKAAP